MTKIISTTLMKVKQGAVLINTPTWCLVVFIVLTAGLLMVLPARKPGDLIVKKLCYARLVADLNDDGRLTLKQTTQECSDGEPTEYFYAPAD